MNIFHLQLKGQILYELKRFTEVITLYDKNKKAASEELVFEIAESLRMVKRFKDANKSPCGRAAGY